MELAYKDTQLFFALTLAIILLVISSKKERQLFRVKFTHRTETFQKKLLRQRAFLYRVV